MALLNGNDYQLSDAIARGHQHWKAVLDNWGNLGASADPNNGSTQYDVPVPVVGVQIAHTSQVGEVRVVFNTGRGIKDADAGSHISWLYCDRNQPYMWRTPAMITIEATPETCYYDTYYPSTDPFNTAAFGGTLLNWWSWQLNAILFLDHEPAIHNEPSGELSERRNSSFIPAPSLLPLYPTEYFDGMCVFPIQHRKEVRLELDNLGADQTGYGQLQCRVGGIRGSGDWGLGPSYEFDLMSAPIIVPEPAGGHGRRVNVQINTHDATWLTLHLSSLEYQVRAQWAVYMK